MPYYLVQVAYTPEAWGKMVKNPQNRIEAVRPAVEKLGGKLQSGWLAFGKYDVVVILEMPDNVSAAGIAMAFAAGGAVKTVATTVLMTPEEGMRAMKKAAEAAYRPPA